MLTDDTHLAAATVRCMSRRDDQQDRLLQSLAAGSAILFAGTVAFVVVAQTLLPIFGLDVGRPSDTILGTMVAAVVTMTTALALRAARKVISGGEGDET